MSNIILPYVVFTANPAFDCLRFAKFRPQYCESFGATYQKNWELCSAFQSTRSPLTDGVNIVQTDA